MASTTTARSSWRVRCTTPCTRGASTRWRRSVGSDDDPVGVGPRRVDPPDLKRVYASHVRLHSRRATTLEEIDPQVMVITVPAHEPHDVPGLCHQVHPHRLVEGLAGIEVCDVEVHVPHERAG